MILYLHGFRSGPRSAKASLLAQALAARGLAHEWACPQLPASPAAAMQVAWEQAQQALAHTGDAGRLVVLGSSLGGFYATWLAERSGCRAVLLNPVVHAARDLATQVGTHESFYDSEPFEFLPGYVDELAQAEGSIATLTNLRRYLLLAATGDEVLDWREMQARFAGSRQRIIEGSDHGISDFAAWLPEVLSFALGADVVPAEARPGSAAASSPERRGRHPAIQIETGPWVALGPEAGTIRTEVFVHEQRVPPEEELDAMDVRCVHALARDSGGRPIGTGRLLPDGHIGRMAVRREWRGQGVGALLLAALMAEARERGDAEVVLAAQLQARGFYARYGFIEEGDTFVEAGIEHRLMRCRL